MEEIVGLSKEELDETIKEMTPQEVVDMIDQVNELNSALTESLEGK